MSYSHVKERLDTNKVIILDGGIGGELERIGAKMDRDLWAGKSAINDPDKLFKVHKSYIESGADIITSNTYAIALEEAAEHWHWLNGALNAEFLFLDFKEAFAFMQQVANLAENHQHHPDWQNIYNKVQIRLHTHDQKAVTELDIELAKSISALYEKLISAKI